MTVSKPFYMPVYDFIHQNIVSTQLIQPKDDDSFYNPTIGHYGFAADGTHYTAGVQDSVSGPVYASWYSETPGPYRGTGAVFPSAGLVLLSKVALTILDGTTPKLNFWMQMILADDLALTNNFNGSTIGFTPRSLTYADGVISVIYAPDEGATNIVPSSQNPTAPKSGAASNMVVTFDFTADNVYLDVAV
jgi:hypothetical protein